MGLLHLWCVIVRHYRYTSLLLLSVLLVLLYTIEKQRERERESEKPPVGINSQSLAISRASWMKFTGVIYSHANWSIIYHKCIESGNPARLLNNWKWNISYWKVETLPIYIYFYVHLSCQPNSEPASSVHMFGASKLATHILLISTQKYNYLLPFHTINNSTTSHSSFTRNYYSCN